VAVSYKSNSSGHNRTSTGSELRDQSKQMLRQRGQPTKGRVANLDQFHHDLVVATICYRENDAQAGVYKALEAVMAFTTAEGIPVSTIQPLLDMAVALKEARTKGRRSELFAVKPISNAPKKSILDDTLLAKQVAIVECCIGYNKKMGSKKPVEEAYPKAALIIATAKMLPKLDAGQLKGRRRLLNSGDRPDAKEMCDILMTYDSQDHLLMANRIAEISAISLPATK
jgi:hypothetical protein